MHAGQSRIPPKEGRDERAAEKERDGQRQRQLERPGGGQSGPGALCRRSCRRQLKRHERATGQGPDVPRSFRARRGRCTEVEQEDMRGSGATRLRADRGRCRRCRPPPTRLPRAVPGRRCDPVHGPRREEVERPMEHGVLAVANVAARGHEQDDSVARQRSVGEPQQVVWDVAQDRAVLLVRPVPRARDLRRVRRVTELARHLEDQGCEYAQREDSAGEALRAHGAQRPTRTRMRRTRPRSPSLGRSFLPASRDLASYLTGTSTTRALVRKSLLPISASMSNPFAVRRSRS